MHEWAFSCSPLAANKSTSAESLSSTSILSRSPANLLAAAFWSSKTGAGAISCVGVKMSIEVSELREEHKL